MRVLLGIATAGKPTQPFLDALAQLRLPANVEKLERSIAIGNFIPGQRELIAQDAIAGGYDFLFFVDDDIALPNDALEKLVETALSDPLAAVVGGLYYMRDNLKPIAVANWRGDDTTSAYIPPFRQTSTDCVDGVGFGCALLRVAPLAALEAPYFPAHIFLEPATRRVRQCNEDYLYCERVRKAGNSVRLDARVRCGHFDRERNIMFPLAWESDEETSVARMLVSDANGPRLVPYVASASRTVETLLPASVTYLRSEG